ncbi:hypothetical protein MTR67_042034 [Solanum verrucosum]|uniref:VPS28 N-terminal domain-containing protein n=1 Tax=Solanum verrucosum TaxID=315347 RepID=A0AAF0ZTQ8_SOLVR|nr:vacuolar protein sorting-associated protein 28 homolog 2-like [Solanum verrucosum]WMV48649.1 hypothetical protein MTR67_042034 [Solanum verrucosum]
MDVKLWNDKREREMYDDVAELFAIITATEKLEKAFVRDIISPADYETECQKLISHFKILSLILKDTVPNIKQFHDVYKMNCSAALNRLVTSGVPATIEHRATATSMELSSSLNKLSILLPADVEQKIEMREWLSSLLLIVLVFFVSFFLGIILKDMRKGY